MTKDELQQLLIRYFSLYQCSLLAQSKGHLEVQLCEEIDRDLFHRPFYWSYIESIQGEPETHRLSLITDREQTPEQIEGEIIAPGSPLLQKIYRSIQKRGRLTRLYEEWAPTQPVPLTPWVGMNGTIRYQCDRTQERFFSLGCNTLTGQVVDSFHHLLQKRHLQCKMPPYHYLIRPIFSLDSSLRRLQETLLQRIEDEPKRWADRALQRFRHEEAQLTAYYEELLALTDDEEESQLLQQEWEQREEELRWQYTPSIQLIPLQLGIYYLQNHPEQFEN